MTHDCVRFMSFLPFGNLTNLTILSFDYNIVKFDIKFYHLAIWLFDHLAIWNFCTFFNMGRVCHFFTIWSI